MSLVMERFYLHLLSGHKPGIYQNYYDHDVAWFGEDGAETIMSFLEVEFYERYWLV